MENPIKIDDLGVPLLLETSIYNIYIYRHIIYPPKKPTRHVISSRVTLPQGPVGQIQAQTHQRFTQRRGYRLGRWGLPIGQMIQMCCMWYSMQAPQTVLWYDIYQTSWNPSCCHHTPWKFNSEFTPENKPGPEGKGSSSSPIIFQGPQLAVKLWGCKVGEAAPQIWGLVYLLSQCLTF